MQTFNWIKLLAIVLLMLGAAEYGSAARLFWTSPQGSWFHVAGAVLHVSAALGVLMFWRRPKVFFVAVDPAKP